MPVMEHPFGGSWGYHVTSYFAPDARFGDPDGLRLLVDRLHQAGIGVILDWVPGHFPNDEWALARFDGTPLYEDPNPQRGGHPEWGTLHLQLRPPRGAQLPGRQRALLARGVPRRRAAGRRASRRCSTSTTPASRGEWTPNVHGGRENLEAVQFLQEMNATVYKRVPGVDHDRRGVHVVAGRHPGTTSAGGLGFGFKWNMGWMHDSLGYLAARPGAPRLPPRRR